MKAGRGSGNQEQGSAVLRPGGQDGSEEKAQYPAPGGLPPAGLRVSQLPPSVEMALGHKGAPRIHNGKCLALIQQANRQTGLLAIPQPRELVSPNI